MFVGTKFLNECIISLILVIVCYNCGAKCCEKRLLVIEWLKKWKIKTFADANKSNFESIQGGKIRTLFGYLISALL